MPIGDTVRPEYQERAEKLAAELETFAARHDPVTRRETEDTSFELERSEEVLPDVLDDAEAVGRLVYVARTLGYNVPSMIVREVGIVPIPDPELKSHLFKSGLDSAWRSEAERWWNSVRTLNHAPILFVSVDVSLRGFRQGLSRFLGYRFEGLDLWRRLMVEGGAGGRFLAAPAVVGGDGGRQTPGTAAAGGVGFHIELTCRQQGLAAYASPAYALAWRNLGASTTPARSVLPPGAWIFGAQGSSQQMVHDPVP